MLKFKVKERLLASGTKNPAIWLMKTCGFSKTKAYNIANDKQKMISTADFSQLCYALHCTPNDLIYWQNTPRLSVRDTHPLAKELTPPPAMSNWQEVFKNLSPEEVAAYHKEITARIAEKNHQF